MNIKRDLGKKCKHVQGAYTRTAANARTRDCQWVLDCQNRPRKETYIHENRPRKETYVHDKTPRNQTVYTHDCH